VDLVERVKHILERALAVEDIKLEDDGGLIGYVVSNDFQGLEFVDRQMKIHKALRTGPEPLAAAELRRVAAIAALTPDEFLVWSA
jgi:acid stress-induced BolA-like protein IbaG/YrbA